MLKFVPLISFLNEQKLKQIYVNTRIHDTFVSLFSTSRRCCVMLCPDRFYSACFAYAHLSFLISINFEKSLIIHTSEELSDWLWDLEMNL